MGTRRCRRVTGRREERPRVRSWRNWIAWHPRTQPTLPAGDARELTSSERGWPLRITLLLAVTIALLPIAVVSILQGIERARVDFAEVHDRLLASAQSAAAD